MVVVSVFTDKYCPLARVGDQASNRADSGQPLDGALCMGPDCMAWRWYQEDAQRGYCGAFGEPAPTVQRKPGDELIFTPDDYNKNRFLLELNFAWPMLSVAAAVGDQMTKDEALEGLMGGNLSLILRENSAALLSHGDGFLRIGMAGGVLEEMHSIEEEATKYAKCFDYKYIEIVGRPGWESVLKGYKRVAVVLRKEI